jgi:hypothetical protein
MTSAWAGQQLPSGGVHRPAQSTQQQSTKPQKGRRRLGCTRQRPPASSVMPPLAARSLTPGQLPLAARSLTPGQLPLADRSLTPGQLQGPSQGRCAPRGPALPSCPAQSGGVAEVGKGSCSPASTPSVWNSTGRQRLSSWSRLLFWKCCTSAALPCKAAQAAR